MGRPTLRSLLWVGLAAAIPVAAIPWRTGGSLAIGLATMIAVACAAAANGRAVGLCAGFAGAVSFDLFAVDPYGSLAVARRDDLFAVVAMTIIGVLVGHLADQFANERALRRVTQSELEELHLMLELKAAGESPGRLIKVAERALQTATGVPCRYEGVPFLDNLPELHHASVVVVSGDRGPLATPNLLQLPVCANGATIGRFVLELGPHGPIGALSEEWRRRAVAIADQLGQVLGSSAP